MSNPPHPLQRHHTLTETITFSSISFCSGYLWACIQSPKSPISNTFLLCFAALARRYSCNRAEWSFKTRYDEINTLKIKIYFWTRPTPLPLPLVYYEPSLWIHRIEKREGMTGLLIFFNSLFSSCALYDKVILPPSCRYSLWFPSEAVWGFNLKNKMNTGERERERETLPRNYDSFTAMVCFHLSAPSLRLHTSEWDSLSSSHWSQSLKATDEFRELISDWRIF